MVILPPLVVAELVSGAKRQQPAIEDLLQEFPLHETPLAHWICVGELRRNLRDKELSVSVPDAHVAQCALDLEAVLLSCETVFATLQGSLPSECILDKPTCNLQPFPDVR